MLIFYFFFFFFNDTSTTEIYTLSLHDALPISLDEHKDKIPADVASNVQTRINAVKKALEGTDTSEDRKSTRLNSSHRCISYAVFCLKKKKKKYKKKKIKKNKKIKNKVHTHREQ